MKEILNEFEKGRLKMYYFVWMQNVRKYFSDIKYLVIY